MGFPGGSDVKASARDAGDLGSIPGEGNGNPLQYSCLENPMDRGAWRAIERRVMEAGVSVCGDHMAPPVNTSLPWTGLENTSGARTTSLTVFLTLCRVTWKHLPGA